MTTMRRRLRKALSSLGLDESGAVLVEMTLVAPFMLTLAAGVFEFSNIIHTRLLIEAGIDDSARYIARCVRKPADKPGCQTSAQNIAATSTPDGTGALRVTSCNPAWSAAAVTVTYTPFVAVDPATGVRTFLTSTGSVEVVNVTTTCRYVGTGLLNFLGFSPLTLTETHNERVVGW
jgi:Flp pilus assembly protein TadG